MGALVLSRRVGETIVIDGDIEVTVAGISGNQCRLAIKADPDVVIDRLEIHEKKLREKDNADQ